MKQKQFTATEIVFVTNNGPQSFKFFSLDDEPSKGYFVQDLNPQQNSMLFHKGISLIMTKDGKRWDFLREFISSMLIDINDVLNAAYNNTTPPFTTSKYCHFVAFVCDLANHNNLKDFKGVYDKRFPIFVANLCWNYFLDVDFEMFKNGKKPLFSHYH